MKQELNELQIAQEIFELGEVYRVEDAAQLLNLEPSQLRGLIRTSCANPVSNKGTATGQQIRVALAFHEPEVMLSEEAFDLYQRSLPPEPVPILSDPKALKAARKAYDDAQAEVERLAEVSMSLDSERVDLEGERKKVLGDAADKAVDARLDGKKASGTDLGDLAKIDAALEANKAQMIALGKRHSAAVGALRKAELALAQVEAKEAAATVQKTESRVAKLEAQAEKARADLAAAQKTATLNTGRVNTAETALDRFLCGVACLKGTRADILTEAEAPDCIIDRRQLAEVLTKREAYVAPDRAGQDTPFRAVELAIYFSTRDGKVLGHDVLRAQRANGKPGDFMPRNIGTTIAGYRFDLDGRLAEMRQLLPEVESEPEEGEAA